jgi:hypothetical protein
MTKISMAALAALLVAGIAPANAASDCNSEYKNFFEKLQLNGNAKGMTGDQLADASRKGVRAYDACKSGDNFTVHGVFDQIDADKMKK